MHQNKGFHDHITEKATVVCPIFPNPILQQLAAILTQGTSKSWLTYISMANKLHSNPIVASVQKLQTETQTDTYTDIDIDTDTHTHTHTHTHIKHKEYY